MSYLYDFVVYGFLATAVIGLLGSWVDRKVTARVQYRVGPPLLQPFIDLIKLLGKETLVPAGASKTMFFLAPLVGLSSVILVATLLWINSLSGYESFVGDLIVVLYLLMLPSISIMLGGFASRNPLASLGASREMKLILAYELPFVLAVLVVIIKCNFSIQLGQILLHQAGHGIVLGSMSGLLAFIVVVLCVQAKLGLVPFDVAEAETEIVSGPLIEYSGAALAVYRLMRNMLMFVLPFFIIILFMGGIRLDGIHAVYAVLKYVGVLALITVIRNTNPRVRIDHAVRFFWGPMTVAAIAAVFLAFMGK